MDSPRPPSTPATQSDQREVGCRSHHRPTSRPRWTGTHRLATRRRFRDRLARPEQEDTPIVALTCTVVVVLCCLERAMNSARPEAKSICHLHSPLTCSEVCMLADQHHQRLRQTHSAGCRVRSGLSHLQNALPSVRRCGPGDRPTDPRCDQLAPVHLPRGTWTSSPCVVGALTATVDGPAL